jgi:hypothetical protein
VRTLLTNPIGQRTMRSFTDLIDRRVDRALSQANRGVTTEGEVADLRRQLADTQRRQRALEVLLDDGGRAMARMPSPANFATLTAEIAALTGDATAAKRNVSCAFRILVAFEAIGVGRVAGGTMNICGKLATIPVLDAPNDDVLEIGTLYGLFAASLVRMLERAGRDPQLTVVDPLVGIQLQPGTTERPDASGTPVREEAVRTNLSIAGAAGIATRIRQGYSTDPSVRTEVSDRRYGVIVVDGDHSQAGVAADLEWAEEIAAPGGIVVLDDYGDRKWPGVHAALEQHLEAGSRLSLLGRVATSGYLRAG